MPDHPESGDEIERQESELEETDPGESPLRRVTTRLPEVGDLRSELASLGYNESIIDMLISAAEQAGNTTDAEKLAWVQQLRRSPNSLLAQLDEPAKPEILTGELRTSRFASPPSRMAQFAQLEPELMRQPEPDPEPFGRYLTPDELDPEELRRRMEAMGLTEHEMQKVMTWSLQARVTDPELILDFAQSVHTMPQEAYTSPASSRAAGAKPKKKPMQTVFTVVVIVALMAMVIYATADLKWLPEPWNGLVKTLGTIIFALYLIIYFFGSTIAGLFRSISEVNNLTKRRW